MTPRIPVLPILVLPILAWLLPVAIAGCSPGTPSLPMPPPRPETAASDYYSPSAEEVSLDFDGVQNVKFNSDADNQPVNPGDAQFEVDRIMVYLAGPMNEALVKAGPKYDGKAKVTGMKRLGQGWYGVQYHYHGTFTMERTHGATYTVMLPTDTRTIYARSQVAGACEAARNPCTNDFFPEEYYFWYFWNPLAKGCKLQPGVDYTVYQAKVSATPNVSHPRFPAYDRLVNGEKILPVNIAFGANDDALGLKPPEANADANAGNVVDVERHLLEVGFARTRMAPADVAAYCPTVADSAPTIDVLQRRDGDHLVRIRLFWGSTHLGHHAEGFGCFINDALQSSAVFLYSAHSGLGEAIFLEEMRRDSKLPLMVNRDLYQIFAFNSCSSYGYYNADFFNDKRSPRDPDGQHNLDVISSGTSTDFGKLAGATWQELSPILDWSRTGHWTSYQDIVDAIDKGTLTGVSGVRDNPDRPS